MPKGTKVKLDIRLPQRPPIKAAAKMVWIKRQSGKVRGFDYKIGLQYDKIKQKDLDKIMNFVLRTKGKGVNSERGHGFNSR